MSLKDAKSGGRISAETLRMVGYALDRATASDTGNEFETDWFPAKISGTVTGGYTFVEQWVNTSGTVEDKPSGRVNSSDDPAASLSGAVFATGEPALCRRSFGGGGSWWELVPARRPSVLVVDYCADYGTLPAATYANGTFGVGATLTASANGALTVDGVAVAVGDSVLVNTDFIDGGVYVVTQTGDASHPFILTRRADCDTTVKLHGALAVVTKQNVVTGKLGGTLWQQITPNPFLGFDNIIWQRLVQGAATNYPGASTHLAVWGSSGDLYDGVATLSAGGELSTTGDIHTTSTYIYCGPGSLVSGGAMAALSSSSVGSTLRLTDGSHSIAFNIGFGVTGGCWVAGAHFILGTPGGSAAPHYAVTTSDGVVHDGLTGTIGPGASAIGGIVTSLGSGSYLTDPGDGITAGTYP